MYHTCLFIALIQVKRRYKQIFFIVLVVVVAHCVYESLRRGHLVLHSSQLSFSYRRCSKRPGWRTEQVWQSCRAQEFPRRLRLVPILFSMHSRQRPYIVGWSKNALSRRPVEERPISAPGSRTTYLGARSKNDLSRRPVQERPISAPGPTTTYLGARSKNDLSRRPVEERPISAPDSRTTYLKRDFCFSDFVVAALRDFKRRLL